MCDWILSKSFYSNLVECVNFLSPRVCGRLFMLFVLLYLMALKYWEFKTKSSTLCLSSFFYTYSFSHPNYHPATLRFLLPSEYLLLHNLIIRHTDIIIAHISVAFRNVTYYNSLLQTFIQKFISLRSKLFYCI